jgi:hypothetical protein
MRFLMTSTVTGTGAEPTEDLHAEMGQWIAELSAAGVLLATGGMSGTVATMTSTGQDITVTDGPFAEAAESIGGFALVEVGSLDEALEIGRRFRRMVGDGETTVQQVFS